MTYETPVHPLQIRQSHNRRLQEEKSSSAGAETEKITPERKEIMNQHVSNADSLVTSKLIAFTTNEFKNSVLKLRKPAGDRDV